MYLPYVNTLFQQYEKYVPLKIGAGIALTRYDRCVLLLQRGDTAPTHPSVWSFPGGKYDVEHDTCLYDTALREFQEETGCNIASCGNMWIYYGHHTLKTPDGWTFDLTIYWIPPNTPSPVITLNYEHSQYQWLTYHEAIQLPLMPTCSEFLTLLHQHFHLL